MQQIELLCTLGPASFNATVIKRLSDIGVSLFRINLSHTDLDDLAVLISQIRSYTDTPICLVYCRVDAEDADAIGNEPIYDGDQEIGITTSGAYGHCVGQSLAFAYVNTGYDAAGTSFEIEILGQRRKAMVLAEAVWDPLNKRLKS